MDTEIVGQDRKDLAELSVEAWDAILDSQSPHTRRAYRVQWGAFTRWARSLNHEPLPAAPSTVANYLAARVLGGMVVSSARLAASAIRAAHEAAGYPNPCATDAVRRTLSGLGTDSWASTGFSPPRWTMRRLARSARRRTFLAAARRRQRLAAVVRLTWRSARYSPMRVYAAQRLRHSRGGRSWTRPTGAVVSMWCDPRRTRRLRVQLVAVTATTMRVLADTIRPALPDDKARVFPLSESQVSRRVTAAAAAAGLGQRVLRPFWARRAGRQDGEGRCAREPSRSGRGGGAPPIRSRATPVDWPQARPCVTCRERPYP